MTGVRRRPGVSQLLARVLVAVLVGAGVVALGVAQPEIHGSLRLVTASKPPVWPAQCGSNGAGCLRELTLPGGAKIATYSNYPMSGSPQVTHAMLVVHGAGGDAAVTFTGMMQAAQKAGADVAHTMVLAPWFKTAKQQPSAGEAVWTSGGWKIGDPSTGGGGSISSFEVADDLLYTWADRAKFPNLRWVTVVGHSAGGQFTDRYASFGQAPSQVPGLLVNFVVANPSSFVYFDEQRPGGNTGSCPDFNTYKYGMAGRSGYVARMSPAQAEQTFLSRRVTILNGGADTVQNGDMDLLTELPAGSVQVNGPRSWWVDTVSRHDQRGTFRVRHG